MTMTFEITRRSYAIQIDEDAFVSLMNSESYVTDYAAHKKDKETLDGKLNRLPGVSGVNYSGHYGAAIYLSIDADRDKPRLQAQIRRMIERHLAWCAKLKDVRTGWPRPQQGAARSVHASS